MLDKNGALYKIILLDRAENKEESEELYKKIINSKLSKEEKLKIKLYANNILSQIIGKEKLEKINKECEKNKGGKNMLAETLKREIMAEKIVARKEGREEGRKEGRIIGIYDVAKEMLKSNTNIELIKQWTKLSDKELEKIKSEM